MRSAFRRIEPSDDIAKDDFCHQHSSHVYRERGSLPLHGAVSLG